MAGFVASRHAEVAVPKGFGMSAMKLQKADGRVFVYYSLDYVRLLPLRRRMRWRRAFTALREANEAQGCDAAFVEIPAHPNPRKRERRPV